MARERRVDAVTIAGDLYEQAYALPETADFLAQLLASQDPPSLPSAIIELSSLVILHRFNSPGWLKYVQRSITSLADLTPAQMAALAPGEAYLWATKATERVFTQKAVKARLRPRVTRHGGETKRAG